jgi:hypothetical protein
MIYQAILQLKPFVIMNGFFVYIANFLALMQGKSLAFFWASFGKAAGKWNPRILEVSLLKKNRI